MSSPAIGTHSGGAGPLSLMSCVRESSPLHEFESDTEKNVASKKRFWNPRKWFKRKAKVTEDVVAVETTTLDIGKDALRSRSTSELSITDEGRRRSSGSMHPGLSVSHDSVFHSPNSGSDMELDAAESSSSLSISQPYVDQRLQNELSERLRLRRGREDTSEDDEGLPHSPCNSPTTSDGLLLDKTAIKDLPTKSHSTCSDGSLLSTGSYELDEDSVGLNFRHPSKLSLQEKKSVPDSNFEFGPNSSTTPLNHSAAHHRVAVKPKRTHGAPRRRRAQQLSLALPATPEVNEESSIRSISPEISRKETLTELYSMNTSRTVTETQLKCSSLPPGLIPPGSDSTKLNRSKSNAGSKSQDHFGTLHEDQDKEEKLTLLDRIFPRRSGRKKKQKEESLKDENINTEVSEVDSKKVKKAVKQETISSSTTKTRVDNSSSYTCVSKKESSKPIPAPRSGPASRQRVLPVDIPASPVELRRDHISTMPKSSPEKSPTGTSPLQTELENLFKQKQISLSTSPSPPDVSVTPPHSPKISTSIVTETMMEKTEHSYYKKSTSTNYAQIRFKGEELKSKIKIPGLSSLQQRVLSLNDDEANSFKSLTQFSEENPKTSKPLTKSHSFKTVKNDNISSGIFDMKAVINDFIEKEKKDNSRVHITRASSLDSIQNLDEHMHTSDIELKLKINKITSDETSLDIPENSTIEKSPEIKEAFRESEVFHDSAITISGPSHTAIVNVTSSNDFTTTNKSSTFETVENLINNSHTVSVKEHQVSVTKIHVKRESTQVTQSSVTVPKSTVPEFLSKHLNKVETRPTSNIILSMKSPKLFDEPIDRPKTLFDFDVPSEVIAKPPAPRKFSKENLEIIEKNEKDEEYSNSPPVLTVSSTVQSSRFKKNEIRNSNRKSSLVSVSPDSPLTNKPSFKKKSASLDSLKGELDTDKSSQDSLDKLDDSVKEKDQSPSTETVILRRKSLVTKKTEEEPELMKVFARRSLKLKDSEIDAIQDDLLDNKTKDGDKENQSDYLPVSTKNTVTNEIRKEESVKDILVENKVTEISKSNYKEVSSGSPPVLRKQFNNTFMGQRAVSLNSPKTISSELILKKQITVSEKRKSDQWITNTEDSPLKEKIMSEILPHSDFITEPKNFSQRKAEWEKRAQQAVQKKTTT